MKKSAVFTALFLIASQSWSQPVVDARKTGDGYNIKIFNNGSFVSQPSEGLWSVATAWIDGWPSEWHHASPSAMQESGGWKIFTGSMKFKGGELHLRDAYRTENGMIKCVRRFEWTGNNPVDSVTLSVRWKA